MAWAPTSARGRTACWDFRTATRSSGALPASRAAAASAARTATPHSTSPTALEPLDDGGTFDIPRDASPRIASPSLPSPRVPRDPIPRSKPPSGQGSTHHLVGPVPDRVGTRRRHGVLVLRRPSALQREGGGEPERSRGHRANGRLDFGDGRGGTGRLRPRRRRTPTSSRPAGASGGELPRRPRRAGDPPRPAREGRAGFRRLGKIPASRGFRVHRLRRRRREGRERSPVDRRGPRPGLKDGRWTAGLTGRWART